MEKEMASGAARVGSVMKNFGKGLFAGIAAGGVAGTVAAFGQVAKSIAEIGDQAKRAGVSTDVFQEWKIVAEQARIRGVWGFSMAGKDHYLQGRILDY